MGAHPGESFSSEFNSIRFDSIQWWSQDLRKNRKRGKHISISQHSWKHGWGTNPLHSCLDKMWWWWWWWWHRICIEHSLLTECALFFKWIPSWCEEVVKRGSRSFLTALLKAWVWTETLDSYLNVAVETAKTAGQVLKTDPCSLPYKWISGLAGWLAGLLAWPISLFNSVTLSYSLSTGVLICSEFDPAVCPFFLLIFFQIILSNFNNTKTVEHKGKVSCFPFYSVMFLIRTFSLRWTDRRSSNNRSVGHMQQAVHT